MKRVAVLIVLYLVLGALITSAVAVTFACLRNCYKAARVQVVDRGGGEAEVLLAYAAFGSEYVQVSYETVTFIYTEVGVPQEALDPSHTDWSVLRKQGRIRSGVMAEEAHGWPMRSFRWYRYGAKMYGAIELGGDRRIEDRDDDGTGIAGTLTGAKAIPFLPIWPGLVLDTVFYAAPLLVASRGLLALRGLIRRKRGLCVACGYDLRGNIEHGCPECGWRRECNVVECSREELGELGGNSGRSPIIVISRDSHRFETPRDTGTCRELFVSVRHDLTDLQMKPQTTPPPEK